MSSNDSVTIIVLNWNNSDETLSCVESLRAQSYRTISIIVVDNHSSDNSVEILQSELPDNVVLLRNTKNLGFAGGINVGITYAITKQQPTYIGTLNPDAAADKHWAEELVKAFSHSNDIGAVGGIVINPLRNRVDSFGEQMTIWGIPFSRESGTSIDKPPTISSYTFGITGGSVLYKTSALHHTGLFDEKFFMYYEDIDLAYRLQLRGYKSYVSARAVAYHNQGSSASKVRGLTTYNTFKNLPMLFVKNTPLGLWWLCCHASHSPTYLSLATRSFVVTVYRLSKAGS